MQGKSCLALNYVSKRTFDYGEELQQLKKYLTGLKQWLVGTIEFAYEPIFVLPHLLITAAQNRVFVILALTFKFTFICVHHENPPVKSYIRNISIWDLGNREHLQFTSR